MGFFAAIYVLAPSSDKTVYWEHKASFQLAKEYEAIGRMNYVLDRVADASYYLGKALATYIRTGHDEEAENLAELVEKLEQPSSEDGTKYNDNPPNKSFDVALNKLED